MEDNKNRPTNNSFMSGFLLGTLVGALAVFLLGTKSGKRILKRITEKGEKSFTEFLDKLEKKGDLDEIIEEESSDDEGSKLLAQNTVTHESTVKDFEEQPKVRRFFRGISRHVN